MLINSYSYYVSISLCCYSNKKLSLGPDATFTRVIGFAALENLGTLGFLFVFLENEHFSCWSDL